MRMIIAGAREYSEELLEAVCVRSPLRPKAEMPFANQACVISIRFEKRRDGRKLGVQTNLMIRNRQRFNQTNLRSCGISAGDEGATRRRAHRRTRIPVGKLQTLRRKYIQIRRAIVGPSVTTKLAPA